MAPPLINPTTSYVSTYSPTQSPRSSQPCVSPYASPSVSPPVQTIPINATTLVANREPSPNSTMDPPLASPSSSKGVKRTLPETAASAVKKFKNENYYNNPNRLLETESSPLYKDETNMKMILQHPLAQAFLANSQYGSQLPNTNSDAFASAAADFKVDGFGGRHDPVWATQAQAASYARRAGAFEDYDAEQFKKYWATDLRELSDDEGGKKGSSDDCGNSNENKAHPRDEFDDDGGAGGFSGGKKTDPTLSAIGNRNGYSFNNNKSGSGSTSSYDNKTQYGDTHDFRNQCCSPLNEFNGLENAKPLGYDTGSKYGHAPVYSERQLPTTLVTPANLSNNVEDSIYSKALDSENGLGYSHAAVGRQSCRPFNFKHGPLRNPINHSPATSDFQYSQLRYYLSDWVGHGYWDIPSSIYAESS